MIVAPDPVTLLFIGPCLPEHMYLDVILIQEDAIVPFLVFVPAMVVFVVSVIVAVIVDIAMFVLGECRG
jgi:hypothetical protein